MAEIVSLSEIRNYDCVWLEMHHSGENVLIVTAWMGESKQTVSFQHHFFKAKSTYLHSWRCWSAKPTEERMRETPWEGGVMGRLTRSG